LIAIVTVLILSGLAFAYVAFTAVKSHETTDEVTRTRTFYVADGGVNAAIAEIRSNQDPDNDGLGVLVNKSLNGGTFTTRVFLVTAGTGTEVTAATPIPQDGSVDEVRIYSQGTFVGVTQTIERVLDASVGGLFDNGLFGDDYLISSGTGYTDSYDSRNGSYASQATNVDPTTGRTIANTNGDIGSNGFVQLNGNVAVHGDALAGPGETVQVGPNSTVTGTQGSMDAEKYLPPVDSTSGQPTSYSTIPSNRTFTTGTYRLSSLSLAGARSGYLNISGDVVLYVDNGISITGNGRLTLAPGATLTIINTSGDLLLAGNGIINGTGGIGGFDPAPPANLQIKTATTGTVRIAGTNDFSGVVYAPNASVQLAGTSQTYGAVVGKTIDMGGTPRFHYDEALGNLVAAPPAFDALSWRTVPFMPSAIQNGQMIPSSGTEMHTPVQ
jgi:hypothetical protein